MMALRASLAFVALNLVLYANSAPLDVATGQDTNSTTVFVTAIVTSNVEVLETSTILLFPPSPTLPPSPPNTDTVTPISPSPQPLLPPPSSPVPALPSTASSSPSTASPATVTDVVTVIDTITASPVTVTVFDPVTATQTITVPPTSSSSTNSSTDSSWAAPAQMTDLSCFKVSDFAYGKDNMQIVQGIPAAASATMAETLAVASSVPNATAPPATVPTWDNASSIMQLFYPAGSVNPTTEPQGGADFYATPLDLADAQNVSLAYSVFFPADFDWVLAGKLPGIYGGHKTCSGGDDALSCFSTRLMWREGGAGELYLVSSS